MTTNKLEGNEEPDFPKYVYASLASVDAIMDLEVHEPIKKVRNNSLIINSILISGMIFAFVMGIYELGLSLK